MGKIEKKRKDDDELVTYSKRTIELHMSQFPLSFSHLKQKDLNGSLLLHDRIQSHDKVSEHILLLLELVLRERAHDKVHMAHAVFNGLLVVQAAYDPLEVGLRFHLFGVSEQGAHLVSGVEREANKGLARLGRGSKHSNGACRGNSAFVGLLLVGQARLHRAVRRDAAAVGRALDCHIAGAAANVFLFFVDFVNAEVMVLFARIAVVNVPRSGAVVVKDGARHGAVVALIDRLLRVHRLAREREVVVRLARAAHQAAVGSRTVVVRGNRGSLSVAHSSKARCGVAFNTIQRHRSCCLLVVPSSSSLIDRAIFVRGAAG